MDMINLIGGLLYQWDTDRKVRIVPREGMTVNEVHFSHPCDANALPVEPYTEDGEIRAGIPNILLQKGKDIVAYAVMYSDGGERTVCSKRLPVMARAKPEDYVYTETELMNYRALESRIANLEQNGTGAAQADLSVNDETDPRYVKGRTHWVEDTIVEVLPECTPAYGDGVFTIENAPELTAGETYTVSWNAMEYVCIAQDMSELEAGAVALGDCSVLDADGLTGAGEPFVLMAVDGIGAALALDGSTAVTLSIRQGKRIIHKLDNKFINAEWLATKSEGWVEVYPETELYFSAGSTWNYTSYEDLIIQVGKKYRVWWNGTMYECVAKTFEHQGTAAGAYLGDGSIQDSSLESTGEPFFISCASSVYVLTTFNLYIAKREASEEKETFTLKIEGYLPVYNRIPTNYLPKCYTITTNLNNGMVNEEIMLAYQAFRAGQRVYAVVGDENETGLVLNIWYDSSDNYHRVIVATRSAILIYENVYCIMPEYQHLYPRYLALIPGKPYVNGEAIPVPPSIEVGQTIVVEEIIGGRPSKWKAADIPDPEVERIEKTAEDTTVELEPGKLYVFPEMTELSLTFAAPEDTTIANEYHVIFQSGETATTLTLPDTIKAPDSFAIEASKVYELSVLESCLTYQSWEVAAE